MLEYTSNGVTFSTSVRCKSFSHSWKKQIIYSDNHEVIKCKTLAAYRASSRYCAVIGHASRCSCTTRSVLLRGLAASLWAKLNLLLVLPTGNAIVSVYAGGGGWVTNYYACALFIIDGLGHVRNVVLDDAGFSIPNGVFLAKSLH